MPSEDGLSGQGAAPPGLQSESGEGGPAGASRANPEQGAEVYAAGAQREHRRHRHRHRDEQGAGPQNEPEERQGRKGGRATPPPSSHVAAAVRGARPAAQAQDSGHAPLQASAGELTDAFEGQPGFPPVISQVVEISSPAHSGASAGDGVDISINPTYKKGLNITDELLGEVSYKLKTGVVDLSVRRVQAAAFMAGVNAQVTDHHRAAIGPDLTSPWPHYLWLTLWGLLIGAGITLLVVMNLLKPLLNGMTYAFYLFLALEYLLMFAALKLGVYPPKPQLPDGAQAAADAVSEAAANRKAMESRGESLDDLPPDADTAAVARTIPQACRSPQGRTCLIIPVGWGIKGLNEAQKNKRRADKLAVLTNTLDNALLVFSPTDVFIFHNSSDQELPDQVVMECVGNRGVYVPLALGSKSISAYYGAILGRWLNYEYCIVMDDDTQLCQELGVILNGTLSCDAYCMAIAAASNEEHVSGTAKFLIGIQDIEYKLSDLSKLAQANFTHTSSVLAPHGAINMWRTDLLIDIMQEHNGIFHGEDYQMGKCMRERHPDKRLGFIGNCIINTIAPTTWKDLYRQRYTSWDLAAQQFLWGGFCASQHSAFYMQVLFCLPCRVENIFLRVATLEDVWTALQDYFRVPLLMYHVVISIVLRSLNVFVLVMYLVVFVSQWIIAISLEYIKFKDRPDLQVGMGKDKKTRALAVAFFPIYRFCFSFVRVIATLRFFFVVESIKRTALPIRQMNLPTPKRVPYLYPGLKSREGVEITDSGSQLERKRVDEDTVKEAVRLALKEAEIYGLRRSLAQGLGGAFSGGAVAQSAGYGSLRGLEGSRFGSARLSGRMGARGLGGVPGTPAVDLSRAKMLPHQRAIPLTPGLTPGMLSSVLSNGARKRVGSGGRDLKQPASGRLAGGAVRQGGPWEPERQERRDKQDKQEKQEGQEKHRHKHRRSRRDGAAEGEGGAAPPQQGRELAMQRIGATPTARLGAVVSNAHEYSLGPGERPQVVGTL